MSLTSEQKSAVREWVAKGASIADVQRRLREDHGMSLTYMDTRFLIDDLNIELISAEPAKANPSTDPESAASAEPGDDGAVEPEAIGGGVKVEVDRLTRPGTVVSGTVTFSDGKSGNWGLDQIGRLIFEAAEQGYRPSEADLQQFQKELSLKLQKQGY